MTAQRFLSQILIFAALLFGGVAPAFANLQILPLRVEFNEKKRADRVMIKNTTNQTQSVRIEWAEFYVSDEEVLAPIPQDPTAEHNRLKVEDLMRVAPRKTILPPGASQIVRISYRRPKDLAPGEYVGYISFITKSIDTESQSDVLGREGIAEGNVGIRFSPSYGFNIPVFVRHGVGKAAAELTAMDFINPGDGSLALGFKVTPAADTTWSPYGRVDAIWSYQGEEKNVGFVKNAYVFPEGNSRKFTIPLKETQLTGGELILKYSGTDEFEGQVFDVKKIVLQ